MRGDTAGNGGKGGDEVGLLTTWIFEELRVCILRVEYRRYSCVGVGAGASSCAEEGYATAGL